VSSGKRGGGKKGKLHLFYVCAEGEERERGDRALLIEKKEKSRFLPLAA